MFLEENDLIILDSLLKAGLEGDARFGRIMAIKGEVFRALDNRKTVRFTRHGKSYFVKLHTGIGWGEIFKNLLQFRLPVVGARNEWLAIRRLQELQVDTLKAVGYGAKGWNPARLQSFVITEDLGETASLEDFCRNWRIARPTVALKRALLHKVANIAKRLHESGVNHRDFYLCHFLLDVTRQPSPEHLRLWLIDLHRVQLRPKTPERWRVKDLAGLYFSAMDVGLSQRDLLRFIKTYHGQPLRQILPARLSFWKKVGQRAMRLYFKAAKIRS